VASTPWARSGSNDSVISAVISESRPNSVMNHGAPAAVRARSGCPWSTMRSDARSASARSIAGPRRGSVETTDGARCRHPATRYTGIASADGSNLASLSSPPDELVATMLMLIVVDPRGSRSRCQHKVPVAASATAGGFQRTRVATSSSRSTGYSNQPSSSARICPEARCRPLLTSNTWAKSAPTDTSRSRTVGREAVWRTSISSRMPPATHRRRITRQDAGRPCSRSTTRCTITAESGLGDVLVSVSNDRPSTIS
jgi:hypothetical protein